MTQAVQLAQYGSNNVSLAFKNRIINGAMVIDQRNAGASVTINSATDIYTLDRFTVVGQASDGVYTVARSSVAPAGFVNSLLATVTTADSSIGVSQFYDISQFIEGFNVADLGWGTAGASTVTLSFWVRSSVTGTFGGAIRNGSFNRSYPFSYVISSANTWEQKTITIAGDTTGTWASTNGIGIAVTWSLGDGTNRLSASSAWAAGNFAGATGQTNLIATNGATFYITGVQLEKGTQATSFEYRQYGTELALCQRYYEKSFPQDTVPANGANTTSLATESNSSRGYAAGSTVFDGFLIVYKVTKRANPTLTGFGNSAGQWLLTNNTIAGQTFTGAGDNGFSAYQTQGGTVIAMRGHWTSSAEL